jgi:hypothetical protein
MLDITRRHGFVQVHWDGQVVTMTRSTSPAPVFVEDVDGASVDLFRSWAQFFAGAAPTTVDLDPDGTLSQRLGAAASLDVLQLIPVLQSMVDDAALRATIMEGSGVEDWAAETRGELGAYQKVLDLMRGLQEVS